MRWYTSVALCAALTSMKAYSATSYHGKLNLKDGDITTIARAKEAIRLVAQLTCKENGFNALSYGAEFNSQDRQARYRGIFQCLEDAIGLERVTVYTVWIDANGEYGIIIVPQRFESVRD